MVSNSYWVLSANRHNIIGELPLKTNSHKATANSMGLSLYVDYWKHLSPVYWGKYIALYVGPSTEG